MCEFHQSPAAAGSVTSATSAAPEGVLDAAQPGLAGLPARHVGRRAMLRGTAGLLVAGASVGVAARSAQAATSQNGWPASSSPSAIGITAMSVAGISFPAGVRSGDVYTVLQYVATRFHTAVEPLYSPGCWGYNYRRIAGSSTYSNHASGTALDINAPSHPQGRSGTFSSSEVAAIRSILGYCGGVVRWGGDYSGTKDEMHFEINVRPGDARLTNLASQSAGAPRRRRPRAPRGRRCASGRAGSASSPSSTCCAALRTR